MIFAKIVEPQKDLRNLFDEILGEREDFQEPLGTVCNGLTSLMFKNGVPLYGPKTVVYSTKSTEVTLSSEGWFQTTLTLRPNAYWHLILLPAGSLVRLQVFTTDDELGSQTDYGENDRKASDKELWLIVPGEKFVQAHLSVQMWCPAPLDSKQVYYTTRLVEVV